MTSPRAQQAPAARQTTGQLAERISELLPRPGDQQTMLHWLIGYLGHNPEFTAAAGLYLNMQQRRQAGTPPRHNP